MPLVCRLLTVGEEADTCGAHCRAAAVSRGLCARRDGEEAALGPHSRTRRSLRGGGS